MYATAEQEAHEFDELQEFTIGYNPRALVVHILRSLAFGAIATIFAVSLYTDPQFYPGFFAFFVTLVFLALASIVANLELIISKRPALLVTGNGITTYTGINGAMHYPWNRIGGFKYFSVTTTRNGVVYSSIYLDIFDNTPQKKMLIRHLMKDLALEGPHPVIQLENFAAQHKQNHPERFVPSMPTFLSRLGMNRNRIIAALTAIALFLLVVIISPRLHH